MKHVDYWMDLIKVVAFGTGFLMGCGLAWILIVRAL